MDFASDSLALNGCKIVLRRAGSGEPVLFLHGTEGLIEWPSALDLLAQRFEVIVPDLPGFGESEVPPWFDDISDLAYFYLDALEALGLTRVHLVGQSLGGWIALEMAVRCRHHLRSLTLISAAGIHLKGVPKADIFMIDPQDQARMIFVDPRWAEAASERAVAEAYQDALILNRMASARYGWRPRFFNPRLERWLHRVRVPTHIIWGDQDKIIPPAYADAFHSLIPGSVRTLIPQAGHMPHVERADAVAASIERFVSDLDAGRPA